MEFQTSRGPGKPRRKHRRRRQRPRRNPLSCRRLDKCTMLPSRSSGRTPACPNQMNILLTSIRVLDIRNQQAIFAIRLQLLATFRTEQQMRIMDVPPPKRHALTRQDLEISQRKMHVQVRFQSIASGGMIAKTRVRSSSSS